MKYRPDLDGLRSLAVYLVLFFHAGMVTLDGGFVGVDLFFVLSGFLVTSVIVHEVDDHGRFRLGDFYARRVRRLLPAALVVIAVTSLVQVLVASLPARLEMLDDARAALLYVANWHFIGESRDYFAGETDASPFLHFWSLAIEEQFYIVFPLVVLLCVKLSRRPLRALAIFLVVVTCASLVMQLIRADDVTYSYYATDTRAYQLGVGALLALLVRSLTLRGVTPRLTGWGSGLAVVGLALLLFDASRWFSATPSQRGIVAAVASGLLIAGCWWAPRGPLSRLLALPIPRYLGQISYGTYLWHWPVLLVLHEVFDARPLALGLLGAGIATGLAALSYVVLENPIRRAPVLVTRRWSTVAGGLAASVLTAVVVLPLMLESQARPALAAATTPSSQALAALDRPLPKGLDLVRAAGDQGPVSRQCTTADLTACTLVTGTGRHVLLVGDSQAQSYIPAMKLLAEEHDLTLSANVVPACPWQLGQVNLRAQPEEQRACTGARDDFYAEVLPAMDVDVVLAIGLSRSESYWEDKLSGGKPGEALDTMHLRTTRATAVAIEAAGADLVIAKSMFGTDGFNVEGPDPIECLSRATTLADCAVLAPRDQPAVDALYSVLAADEESVATIDPNQVICPGFPVCSPVLGGEVVWRDPDHVTTALLSRRRDVLWSQLEASGFLG